MSKRALTKYLQSLDKEELENQVLELYDKFKSVRDYYGFVFNPKEDKLIDDAKFKVYKEYFPNTKRRAKARRSVAQKAIKHFLTLEMDPSLVSEFMLYNIETAMRFNARKAIKGEAFYKSIYGSFRDAVTYIDSNGLKTIHWDRMNKILEETENQEWFNAEAFEIVLSRIATQ